MGIIFPPKVLYLRSSNKMGLCVQNESYYYRFTYIRILEMHLLCFAVVILMKTVTPALA